MRRRKAKKIAILTRSKIQRCCCYKICKQLDVGLARKTWHSEFCDAIEIVDGKVERPRRIETSGRKH